MNSLPIEVAQLVLFSAPDSRSLRSLVLSNRLFYSSFLALESEIIPSVMHNEFDPAVLPDLLATINSRKIAHAQGYTFESFLAPYRRNALRLPSTWSFCDSLSATKMKEDAVSLTLRFVDSIDVSALSKRPGLPLSMSQSEVNRIHRSLYRYELYCNLFPLMKYPGICGRTNRFRSNFFEMFAPWENEQFVAIYEFLWLCVSEGISSNLLDLATAC